MSPQEAVAIATEAYIYGYSLVTTDVARIQMSNVARATELQAPLNRFLNVKRYPPADYRGVSAPNADTLYSIAWLDLKEPQVFSHPDRGKRFHLFPMVDLWMMIFASPGSRTGDGKAANYLITGPGWKAQVPRGLKHIPAATRYIVILGRTYAIRDRGRLRGRQHAAGAVQNHAALGLGQAVQARRAPGRPQPRHLDGRQAAGGDPDHGHRGLHQLVEQAPVHRRARRSSPAGPSP